MKLRIVFLAGTCGAFALALGLFGGCGDSSGTGGGGGEDVENPELEDVIYEAEATDEALEALVDATPQNEPEKAAVFDSPMDGAVVPATPAPTFSWHDGTQASLHRSAPPSWLTPSPPRQPPSTFERLGLQLLERALSNVPAAYAHGTPVNGPGYFLVLSTASDPKLVRVFTLATEYTPDTDAWSKVVGASGTITATIVSAQFEENRVLQDGGPWESEPITFTVGL